LTVPMGGRAMLTAGGIVIGLVLSATMWAACAPPVPDPQAMTSSANTDEVVVQRFGPIAFGASGVTQLADGRLLIADDEPGHPLVAVDLFGDGRAKEFTPAEIASVLRGSGVKALNDLEGMAVDARDNVYATTSHSVTRARETKQDRQVVVRFRVLADAVVELRAFTHLEAALALLDPALAASIGASTKERSTPPGLNIEGLAWDPRNGHLLFGLRGPLRDGRAQIITMENPDDVFERGASPKLSGPVVLDLEGQGIRDLAYDADVDGFLIVAGASGTSEYGHPELWRWSGRSGDPPLKLHVPAIENLKPEGVTGAMANGRRWVVFVNDDGVLDTKFYNGKAPTNTGTPSRYVLLPLDVLLRDNPGLRHRG